MSHSPADPRVEREQTDESLRAERERADVALGEKLAALEETADALIIQARDRADAVLSLARARTDRMPRDGHPGPRANAAPPIVVQRERASEDEALRVERETADEVLRVERAEHVALLSAERGETDKDLSSERARSDVAVARRDEFLGIVGHDLRNLLNAMVGFAGVIAEGAGADEGIRADAQRIQRSGARMNRLIGDLVDVASIDAGTLAVSLEMADPGEVVREAVETLRRQADVRGVSLVAETAGRDAVAAFDPARVLQVLVNLLSNALKFTAAGGHVSVRVEPSENDVRIEVQDTGQGIPAEKLVTIFERFIQVAKNDRRGLGLGLFISKCIVQGHGGRIWAESTLGRGSKFCFTLPRKLHPAIGA